MIDYNGAIDFIRKALIKGPITDEVYEEALKYMDGNGSSLRYIIQQETNRRSDKCLVACNGIPDDELPIIQSIYEWLNGLNDKMARITAQNHQHYDLHSRITLINGKIYLKKPHGEIIGPVDFKDITIINET